MKKFLPVTLTHFFVLQGTNLLHLFSRSRAAHLVLVLLMAVSASAVPIKSGTYPVTAGSTNNVQLTDLSFVTVNSIGSAVALLNANGVEFLGTVHFQFAAGYTETASSQYDIGSAGSVIFSNPYTQVYFEKTGVGANPVLTASITGANSSADFILRLNGADNITFDGIDFIENTANTMTASTTASTTVAPMEYGVHIRNSGANPAQNNTIKNCVITLYNFVSSTNTRSSSNTYGIYQLCDVAGALNSGNVYDNVNVTKSYRGIVINGMPGNEDIGCVVRNCTVGGAGTGDIGGASTTYGGTADAIGVRVVSQQDFTFFNNTVQNIQYARTSSGGIAYGVFFSLTTGTSTINNNKIYKIINQRTGSFNGAPSAGLQIEPSSGTTNVYNNMIGSIQSSATGTTTFMLFGIRVQGAGNVNLYHNSVSLPNVAGSGNCSSAALCAGSTATNTAMPSVPDFTGTMTVVDNMLSNRVVNGGGGRTYSFLFGSGTLTNSDYNILDITPSASKYYTGNYLGTLEQSLANWQSVAGEANSKQFVVPYLSATDLHLNLAAPNPVYTGTFISSPSITTDIDGETRINPFIGADEKIFTLAPQVFISNNNPDDSLVALNTTNNLLAGIALNVSGVSNTLTSITFSTAGLYTTAGLIDFTNVTLWYSSSPVFTPATSTVLNNTTYVTTMPAAGVNNLAFTFSPLTLPLGATYIYVTFNVALNATPGHNVRVASTSFSNINFGVSGTTKIGTDPVPQGGLQVIAQFYYNKPNLDITLEANWYENVSGFAQPPTNFTDPNQVFVFIANTGATMGLETALPSWNVSGTNTKIFVGDGINPVIFEAKLPVFTTGGVVMNVRDKGTVKFLSSSIPTTLGTLDLGTASTPGSTVEYGDTSVTVTNQNIIAANYCNLTLSGTTTGGATRIFPPGSAGTVGIARVFTPGGFPGATQGQIVFNGGIVTQTIPTGFNFWRLRVNNSIGSTTLAGNLNVDSLLRFTTNLNVTAGQTITLGTNAYVFAPTVGGGILNITGAGAALTNTNPLTTVFAGTAANLAPYIVFGAGSFYNLSATLSSTANNYGQIPPATWDVNSTINITNVTSAGANNMVIGSPASFVFGNITFDAPALSANYRLFGGLNNTNTSGAGTVLTPWTVNLLGNLTLGRSNGFTVDLGAGTSTESYTMTVAKKLIQSDGIYRLLNSASTTQKAFLTITDDITLSNATQLILDGPLAGSTATLNVGANFTANAGTTVTEGATGVLNKIIFTKAGTQVLTTTGATFSNDINYSVNNGSTTQLGISSPLMVNTGAYINLLTGGIFDITAGNTLTVNGLINTSSTQGTFSGTATSNLQLGGTANGSMGTAYFTPGSAILNNLSLDRGVAAAPSVIFGGNTGLTIHGTLTIGSVTNTNNTLDIGTNAIAAGGSFATSIAATGVLKTQHTATALPLPANKSWGGTVWYNSAAAQTMVSGSFNILNGTNGSRTLSPTGTIGIAATGNCFIPGAGAYTIDNSTVDFNGSGSQNIPAFTFENMISSNGSSAKTLAGNVAIRESLTLGNTTSTNLAAFNLSLLSTAVKTARLNPVTTAATLTYGTGQAFVQRYLPARRAWRLMAAPIDPGAGTHTISQAWQEGQTNYATDSVNNPVNGGFATQITGGSIANGFDQSPNNSTSIKYFSAGSWLAPANTNSLSVNSKEGWMVFVRGDRKNFGVITTQYKAPTVTTLRPRGQLFIGNKSVASTGITVVGNPYASAVDYNTMTRTGGAWPANPTYYVWDPYLGGAQGVGAFVTLTWNGTDFTRSAPLTGTGTSNYDNRYIPSGAAILVDFPAGANLQIKETDKNAANTTNAFRPVAVRQMRTVLNSVNADNSTYVNDGTLSLFDNSFSNDADVNDANKIGNYNENILIEKDKRILSIERRKIVAEGDTVFYGIYRLQQKNYQLQFLMENMEAASNLAAFLEDLYLKKKTPVNMQGETTIDFTVNGEAASNAVDRFRLVFKKSAAYTAINAFVSNSDIVVDWKVAEEFNISHYEVERSLDGSNFTKVNETASKGNSDVPAGYNWLDAAPAPGEYFYRIKSISNNGIVSYSQAVKLKIVKGSPVLYIFPNPVTNGNIQLQLNSAAAGKYSTKLFSSTGQLVNAETIIHTGGTATKTITVSNTLTSGNYQLEVTAPGKKVTMIQVLVNKN